MTNVVNIEGHTTAAPKPPRFDTQDAMVLLGFIALEIGVARIYWPAALIIAGLLFFASAAAIERSKRVKTNGTSQQ